MKKYIFSLIAYFIVVAAAQAAPEAEFIQIRKDYTFRPDGSSEVRYHKQLKLNTHIAFNDLYGETFIIYNPKYQTIKFNSSYTRQADGTIIKAPVNAFNEVLPSDAANAPAFNHLREMVVTHTGLEIGATIFLDYTIETKAGYLPQGILPETDDILEEQSPVKEYIININVPSSLPLNYILLAGQVKPKITENGGMKQYSWQFRNIPAAVHEPNIPGLEIPRLSTCCYDSQSAALKALQNIYKEDSDDIVKNTVKEIVNDKKTNIEKIIAIQQFVVNSIALCRINLEQSGYTARTPAEVFHTAYGTPTEKNRLLAEMLKNIGMNPELLILYPSGMKKGVKGLNTISESLLKVSDNGKPVFISALSYPTESMELKGQQHNIWMVSDKETLPLEIVSNSNMIDYKANIQLTPEKALTNGRLIVKGGLIPTLDQNAVENHIRNMVSLAGKLTSTKVNSSEARNADLDFSAEKQLNSAHNILIYELPEINTGIGTWYSNLNSTRKNQYKMPYPISESYTYTVTLAPDMALATKHTDISISKPFGKLRITIIPDGNTVTINKEIQFAKTILSPSEYQDFRNMLNLWNSKQNKTLLINTR